MGLLEGHDSKLTRGDLLKMNRELISKLKQTECQKWDNVTTRLEQKVNSLSKQLQTLERAKIRAENQLFGKQDRIDHLKRELTEERKSTELRYQRIKILENEVEDGVRAARNEQGQREELERRLIGLERAILELEASKSELKSRIRKKLDLEEGVWGRKQDLELRVLGMEAENEALRKENGKVRIENDQIKRTKNRLETFKTELVDNVTRLEKENVVLGKRIEEREGRVGVMEQKVDRVGVFEVEINALRKENIRLRDEMEGLREQVLSK